MSTIATIDLQPRSITLAKSKDGAFFEGNFKLSMTNVSDKRFNARVELRPDGNTKAEWIEVDKSLLMFDFEVNKVADIPIMIKVPASQPEGTYGFMTKLVDTALPDERSAKLPASFDVPKVVAPVVEKKPLPKWLIPLIVGVVVLLAGGGVGIYFATKGPSLGSKCDPAKPECPETIACDTGRKQCLAAIDQECKKDDHCVTTHCVSGKCGPLQAGDECEPAAHLCAEKLECSEQAKRCVGTIGARCAKNEECITNKCTGSLCAALAIGEACTPTIAGLCAPGLVCPDSSKKCLADLGSACTGNADCVTSRCDAARCAPSRTPPGQPCGANFACGDPMLSCDKTDNICRGTVAYVGCSTKDHCLTRNCTDGRCAYPEPGAPCTGGCPANQDCVAVNNGSFCLLKPGQACESSKAVLCGSQVCNQAKQCAPHDGSCQMPSDCPSIASCQGGTCKVPNGRQCLKNSGTFCQSGFCINGLCKPSPCGACARNYYCDVATTKCTPYRIPIDVIRQDITFSTVALATGSPATLHTVAVAARTPAKQNGWEWCSKCGILHFDAGVCPAGGVHSSAGSGDYILPHGAGHAGQTNWRWCSKCQGLVYGARPGVCPAGGAHSSAGSGDYTIPTSGAGQTGWRWCSRCEGLFYSGSTSRCPAGGAHTSAGSAAYVLPHQ